MREFKSPPKHRTPLYRAKSAFRGMQARCLNANGKSPTYADVELRMTMEEWLRWSLPEYERFVREHPNETPNAARMGDAGHYELGNIRIVTLSENCYEQKARFITRVMPDGTKRCSGCKEYKVVGEYSKNGARPDGLNSHCKDCIRGYNQARTIKNGGTVREFPVPRGGVAQCGTEAGYHREIRLKIPRCADCLAAHREYVRKKRS